MKKTSSFLLIIFVISTGVSSFKYRGNIAKPPQPTKTFRMSLNGYTDDETSDMVKAFAVNPGVFKRRTSCRFTKAFIDSLDKLLTDENADGVRIYLARKADGTNTFIWVSTMEDGPDLNIAGVKAHLDYFGHSAAFLKTSIVKPADEDESDNNGALLYTDDPCVNGGCKLQGEHAIDCNTAKIWAKGYLSSVYNIKKIETKSEWFGIGYIHDLKKELNAVVANRYPDGIRLYLGFRNTTDNKHDFIIATTEKIKKGTDSISQDYYECFVPRLTDDNGEQCPNNCKGATLPQP